MRFKNRYLVVQLLFSPPSLTLPSLTSYQLFRDIRQSLLTNFGEFGYGQCHSSLQVKYLNQRTGLAIVRSPRDDSDIVRTALLLLKDVGGEPCTVRVLHVGGTIRSCQKAAVKWTRTVLIELWRRKVAKKQGRGSDEVRAKEAASAKEEVNVLMQDAEAEINKLET
jgi:ribonuclease P/MRP protein subunit POP5